MTQTNLQTQELNNSRTHMSYGDVLRETQQAEFPLLSEVTRGVVDDPIALMNARTDEEGTVVPCPLPDSMTRSLPRMMSETLSLYHDADIRTIQLLPHSFTTAVAVKQGEEMGIKERAVRHHLRTLCVKGYIERLRQGVYRKVTKRINNKIRQAA